MSLLLRVKALAEAIGADIKSIKTDPRLTDSREWSGDTVTQAEAEAGTKIVGGIVALLGFVLKFVPAEPAEEGK